MSHTPKMKRIPSSITASLAPFTPRLLVELLADWNEHSLSTDGESQSATSEEPSPNTSPETAAGRSIREARDSVDVAASLAPFSCELYSVILFIDVSGFTPLTESFVRQGAHGLEELTEVMNSYFSSIMAVIQEYGGDLLKVAGDALIAGFYLYGDGAKRSVLPSADCSQQVRSALCCNVMSCALSLQRSCGLFRIANQVLRLHIAVTAGSTHFILVGGAEQRWGDHSGGRRCEFMAVGPALHDLSSTVQQSEAGEVVVSGAAWAECVQHPLLRYASSAIEGCDNRKLVIDQSTTPAQPDPLVAVGDVEATLTALCDSMQHKLTAHSPATAVCPASFLMPALLSRLPTNSHRPSAPPASSHSYLASFGRPPSLSSAPVSIAPPLSPTVQPSSSLVSDGQSGPTDSNWLAEYRRVSVMFIQLPHPDSCSSEAGAGSEGGPSWLVGFQTLFSSVQRCVFNMGGQVRQLLVDDKGCVCIAVFGLSPLTHENDAARAVTASIHILERLQKSGHKDCHSLRQQEMRIGVATGRAYTGLVGGEHRKEYAVYGETVNLAARLMAAAAKLESDKYRILCDEATMQACQKPSRFTWLDPVTVSIKGRGTPLPVFSPGGMSVAPAPSLLSLPDSPASSTPSSPRPRVLSIAADAMMEPIDALTAAVEQPVDEGFGRHEMFDTICELLAGKGPAHSQPVSAGRPVVVLESEAGMGKSHLTRRLIQAAQARSVYTFVGCADSLELTTPYHALQAVLQSIADLHLDTQLHRKPISVRDHLLELLEPQYQPFVTVLTDLQLGLNVRPPTGEKDASDELQVAVRSVVLQQLLGSLLLGLSRTLPRCLLVVEDIHWLDSQSWQLLQAITSSLIPMPILLTTRPFSKQQTIAPMLQSRDVPRVPSCAPELLDILASPRSRYFVLRGLSQEDSMRLAVQTLQCKGLSLALQTAIFEQTDGIPLFIYHLCHYCRDNQLLQIDASGTAAIVSPGQHISELLPSSLEALLASVLDRLSPQTQFAMKVASVIGRYFHSLLLQKVLPQTTDGEQLADAQLLHLLDHAQQHNIIGILTSTPEAELSPDPAYLSLRKEQSLRSSSQPLPRLQEPTANRPARAYRFSHQLVRDAAYNSLLYNQRRELHAKVALLLTEWHKSQELPVSIQSLAQHYWLSLCSANEQLVAEPEPQLLPLAIDHILQSAVSSLNAGSTDAAVVSLLRAIRCIRLVANPQARNRWELRWLVAWMGSQLMLNLGVLEQLAAEFEDDPIIRFDKERPAFFRMRAMRDLRPFAERLLHLMAQIPQSADWPTAEQRQQIRFNALAAMWYASITEGLDALAPALAPLVAMAEATVGPDRNYFRLEAMLAAYTTLNVRSQVVELGELLQRLAEDDYFNRLLNGEQRLTRVALAFNLMSRLPVDLASHQWRVHGDSEAGLATIQKFFAMLPSIMHPASIIFGYAYSLRMLLPYGPEPVTMSLLQRMVDRMPRDDSPANRMMFLVGKVCRLTLSVWQRSRVEAADSAAMVELIEAFCTEGHTFGANFIVGASAMPAIFDYELDWEWPLECHEAMAKMVATFPLFCCGFNRPEMRRRRAVMALKRVRAGVGDREECLKEAAVQLAEAELLTFGARMLELKNACVALELVRLQGSADEAMAKQKVVDALSTVKGRESSPTIRQARRLLQS